MFFWRSHNPETNAFGDKQTEVKKKTAVYEMDSDTLAYTGVTSIYQVISEHPDHHIVGVLDSSHGQGCVVHRCCGESLRPDDLVRFRTTFLDDPSGEVIDAMKVIKIVDGIEGCCVGFLPRRLAADYKDKYATKFAQILAVYSETERVPAKRKREHSLGIATFTLLDDIELVE